MLCCRGPIQDRGAPSGLPRPGDAMTNTSQLTLETVTGKGLRFRATPDSGISFVLDTGPGAAGPDPMAVLLAAVGACGGMDVISILRKKRFEVTGYEIA